MKHIKLYEQFLLEKDTYTDYPAAATKNAQQAIDWRDEHGRDEVTAGLRVGWMRANQLANKEPISADTVKRMAAFNRHRKNSKIGAGLKDTPWKDNGYVAWLLWGGDEGVDWAIKKSAEIDKLEEKKKESFEDKIEGDGYYKGISTSTARKKVDQMKKQSKMDDDNPDAYKEMPGDTKGKNLLKKSKHTKAFDDLYTDEALEEMITNESVMGDLHYMMETAKNFNEFKKMFYEEYSDRVKPNKGLDSWLKSLYDDGLGESLDEKASGDRGPIKGKGIETGLKKKSDQTGVSLPLLRLVMRRGMAAWKSGHRPGAGQEQWGYARVNSFLTKAPGTWGRPLDNPKKNGPKGKFGADADIAKEVISKGEDKKLKTTGLPK